MSQPRCPMCLGETFEIRAKLMCRRCGMILETCCEGGPMGGSSCRGPAPGESTAAPPAPPAPSDDSQAG